MPRKKITVVTPEEEARRVTEFARDCIKFNLSQFSNIHSLDTTDNSVTYHSAPSLSAPDVSRRRVTVIVSVTAEEE